jgi:hypothetical protein
MVYLPEYIDPRQIGKSQKYIILPYYSRQDLSFFQIEGAKNIPELHSKIRNIIKNHVFQIARSPTLSSKAGVGMIAVYQVVDRKKGRMKLLSNRTDKEWEQVLPPRG